MGFAPRSVDISRESDHPPNMPRSIVASALGPLLLLANPTMGMTGWWTWSEYALTPHFAFQDPGSGDLVHTACNSNGSAVFPTDKMHKFPIKAKPKPATPLAIVGWYDDELETTVVSDVCPVSRPSRLDIDTKRCGRLQFSSKPATVP